MSSALTFIVLGYTNLIGSQSGLNNSAISPGSIVNVVQGPATPRREDYTYTPGIGAHKIVNRASTWNRARRYCEQEGAHLAIINTIAEAGAIFRLLQLSGVSDGWIGAHDQFEEGDFVTIHDETLGQAGFDSWYPGEPNNAGGNEDCVILGRDVKLNDIPCASHRAAVCELPSAQLYVVQTSSNSAHMATPKNENLNTARHTAVTTNISEVD